MKNMLNSNLIYNIIKYAFIILFAIIFLLLFFIDTRIEYSYANDKKIDNYICLGLVTFTFLIFFIINKKRNKRISCIITFIEKKEKVVLCIMFILLFITQLIITTSIYFKTGWDASQLFATAKNYAQTNVFENNSYYWFFPYFEVYPNNIFLGAIFGIIAQISTVLNISDINMVLVVLSIILVDIAGIVTVKTIDNFTSKKIFKVLGAFLFVLFIGLSPWYIIPYSDTYSILFPICVLYNYTKQNKKHLNYFFIGLFSYLGYIIKPTNIIILIAILIIELFKIICKHSIYKKIIFKNFLALFCGILLVIGLNQCILKVVNYTPNNTYTFSPYHYLMMGLNNETTGTYSSEDVLNSLSIDNYDERVEYNKTVFLERLNNFSFTGFFEFYAKKLLVNYNDGTFSWGKEGLFFLNQSYNDSPLSKYLKNIFYTYKDTYIFFSSTMQTIWIFILSTILIGTLIRKLDYKISVIYLTIIGLTLFVLLFEARARYLYVYAPYFIILSITSIEIILNKFKNKSKGISS